MVQQQVLGLEVAVENVPSMQVVEGGDHARGVELGLRDGTVEPVLVVRLEELAA